MGPIEFWLVLIFMGVSALMGYIVGRIGLKAESKNAVDILDKAKSLVTDHMDRVPDTEVNRVLHKIYYKLDKMLEEALQ